MENPSAPIVVYCDGSASSLEAALWAIDEALWRRTWMRLVAVVTPGSTVVARLLEQAPELEHTVVVGATDSVLINEMVRPPAGSMSRMAGNSLLVVPNPDHCPPMSTRRQATPATRDDRPARRSHAVLAGSSRSR